jgi:radical SAM superfamily enzyme YgiQ (UPF0313 family)
LRLRLHDLAPILRTVEKPGRYVGGEFGAVVPGGDAALRVALSYPDLYEIGMSNAAIRILYALLNRAPGVSCERVFAPAPDYEAALRAAGLPLASLETGTPLCEFDIVAFSVGYELTLTNLLAILDTGGVAVESALRGPRDPIVIGGGPAATNPLPLGELVDAVFVGEAEGWLERAFARMAEMKRKGAARVDLLGFLRSEPSVWFPGRSDTVHRAYWRGFATSQADARFPVPSVRVVQDHGSVEIMRGCPNACRFCHATVLYRPTRLKRPDVIAREVRTLVEEAGYREVTLSSLSSGDFRDIHDLVRSLNRLYASRKVSFSLPSLRVDSLALGLLLEISEVRKSGLTFAVETVRPDWQEAVRKTVTLDKTIALMREAKARGWKAAKFYFMVGLPPSFSEDESGSIIDFLRAVRSATGMSLNVNIASFIPKPHTPWERAGQLAEEPAAQRIMAVRKGLAGDGFKIGFHAPILSLLEGIVSRGDERAGRLVLEAFRRGARLDAWEEHVKLDTWRDVIADAGWDVLAETCRPRAPDEALPWRGISLGLTSSIAAEGDPVDPMPPVREELATPVPAAPEAEKVLPTWSRVIFSFAKSGPASFISHLDLMAVFERALARAGFRVRFTEGYNPKPRLEFANPLSLGIDSEEEIAGIDLHDENPTEDFSGRLNAALPAGMHVLRAQAVADRPGARRRSLMSLYWGGDFEVREGSVGPSLIRLPGAGPSIRKTLEAQGTWMSARTRRVATWATGVGGEPVSYFDAFGSLPAADS